MLNYFVIIFISLFLMSCSSSSSNQEANNLLSHQELADDFVEQFNLNSEYNVQLVKADTKQDGFIVVQLTQDDEVDVTFDAYDLSGYSVGSNINDFIDNAIEDGSNQDLDFTLEEDIVYLDSHNHELYELGRNTGYDEDMGYFNIIYNPVFVNNDGVQFSKVAMTSADSNKANELIDGLKLKRATEQLTVQFGLNSKRAREVSSYAMALKNLQPHQMTTYTYDRYASLILGSTYTNILEAQQEASMGDPLKMNLVLERAAKKNNKSKRAIEELLAHLFIKN